ncbi:MAG TPA: hypothetical protein VK137_03625, partial [Planctomycetaceae bacterium]|nr:hypothetical protein [Planctomycetaceae bacterium]
MPVSHATENAHRAARLGRLGSLFFGSLLLSGGMAAGTADDATSTPVSGPDVVERKAEDTIWSLRPLVRPNVPRVHNTFPQFEPANAIDQFVLSMLIEKG